MVKLSRFFSSQFYGAVTTCAAFFVPKNSLALGRKKLLMMSGFALAAGLTVVQAAELRRQPSLATDTDTVQTDVSEVKVAADVFSEAPEAQAAPSQTVSGGSNMRIKLKSSVSSGTNGTQQETTITREIDGNTEVIRKESADGRSSVKFEVSSGADAEAKVRDRGNRLKIEVKEKKETSM